MMFGCTLQWSFGVLTWEVLNMGLQPYTDVDNGHIKSHIRAGNRLGKPDIAPVGL